MGGLWGQNIMSTYETPEPNVEKLKRTNTKKSASA